MQQSRWGMLARGLVAAAAVLSAAIAAGRWPGGAWWSGAAAWALAAMLLAALAALWLEGRAADRMHRQLAIGLSHHVRTPLAHIRMFTEMLLLGRASSQEEQQRWLEVIDRETHRLGDLAENLVLVAHDPDTQSSPVRRPTDLGALLEDVAASFAHHAEARRVRIVADPPAGVMVLADTAALRQALANLLDNALRYGPAGQTITLTLRAGSGHATIAVADGGAGIALPDRKRIWKPFVRLGHADAAEHGSGLGLAVVNQVVRAHGGHAYVEDSPGGGALFCIVLPMLESSDPVPSQSLASRASHA